MLHGVINVYKEKGYTSHDVVAKLRGILGQKKIGHTGTLDPDAIGVLPVCLGKATKLCDMLTDQDKTYEAVLLLGKITDTQDISGTVLKEQDIKGITADQVLTVIDQFRGAYEQIPPMYSALKVNGKKLYELARKGIEVERKARLVHIYDIRVLGAELPRVRLEVRCSKGTYIRTLCHDIGVKLSCGGCMEALVRTKVGRFCLSDGLTLSEIAGKKECEELTACLVPVDVMFENYKRIVIKIEKENLAYNGNAFGENEVTDLAACKDQERFRLYNEAGAFIAIYQYNQAEKTFTIVKMFYSGNDK